MGRDQAGWHVVGEQFSTIGDHIKAHFDQPSAHAVKERKAFEDSLHQLIALVEEGLAAVGETVRDPQIRTDVGKAAESVRAAVTASLQVASKQTRPAAPRAGRRPAKKGEATSARRAATASKRPAARGSAGAKATKGAA